MLVGAGALRFARAYGFPEENLLTERARLAWLVWKQSLRDAQGNNNWSDGLDAPPATPSGKPTTDLRRAFPGVDEPTLAWAWEMATRPPTGTINCLALNRKGEMSGVTTTSGLAWKIPGRVGDSPILGAGNWVDADAGAAGSTGRGEANLYHLCSHLIVELMRQGRSPKDAALEALRRVCANTVDPRLLRRPGIPRFDLKFYVSNLRGECAGVALFQNAEARFAVCDANGPRLEPMESLLPAAEEVTR
jgi:N4-(beta-N-acetylglucosaminyl)-L-asparaginase